ncbi:MAG: phosphoheptose isomerase [Verrucomicrobia bacterium 21-51-4]|nr:MAG: phosphoheptose isomerase [Verrucomicrobia bacterium 21-51-4]HQU08599.1 SIS domain-containing protein [Opitutales bacterium]
MHTRHQTLLERYPALEPLTHSIQAAYEILEKTYHAGGKVLFAGNGGSAADADHICGELLKGFYTKRPLSKEWYDKLGPELGAGLQGALPAIPLPDFTGLVTAFSNDCNPEHVFAQLTWGLGKPEDTLFAITTSGNSKNIIHAVKVAHAKGMKTIGLTGESGGQLKSLVDVCICAPATETYKIQEFHLPIYHALCLMLEDTFFPSHG